MLIDANMKPWMDEGELKAFMEFTSQSKCYLEYGCGGSTVYAANVAQIPSIISVDTDKVWIEKVKAAVVNKNSKLNIEHCDLGEVGEWGVPKNADNINDFWMYMALPWHIAKESKLTPDTVLVDGRFRVASFLYSLVAAEAGTKILFDDYFSRAYSVAESFCRLQQRYDNMALFIVDKNFSYPEIMKRIAQYSIQPMI